MKIVCISDTHNKHEQLTIPECDLLIHAGDWSSMGREYEIRAFAMWLGSLTQAKHIVVIPGNHELIFEQHLPASKNWFTEHCPRAHLLIDETCEIEGVKIYGSPATPQFCNWAWNRAGSFAEAQTLDMKEIQPHWDAIPEGTDILVTHGPPYGILDQTIYADGDIRPEHLGCERLMRRIREIKPALHFFGHIHHSGGNQVNVFGTSFYNAAVCDELYCPTNPITIVDFNKEEG